jgi:nucleoside-diphosphate-sugar epimerase
MKITIVGCGYTGGRLARRLRADGHDVLALVRSRPSLDALRADGIPSLAVDLDEATGDHTLAQEAVAERRVIYMVPPPASGDTDPRVRRFLEELANSPRCIVYLSSSAVYGDRQGARVDESTDPAPATARARCRLDAETLLLRWGEARGTPVRVLRVPGIYGPDRLPLERLAGGAYVPADSESGPGNRIHVDDLVGACIAAAVYEGPHRLFNVGDGDHASMSEYFRRVAVLAGLPPPREIPLARLLDRVSPMMRSFLSESRRLDTQRMRRELLYIPRYADLDAGIAASLREMGRPA